MKKAVWIEHDYAVTDMFGDVHGVKAYTLQRAKKQAETLLGFGFTVKHDNLCWCKG